MNEVSLRDRTEMKLADPATLDMVLGHVANGGTLIGLCKVWDVMYSDVVLWIYKDEARRTVYERALEQQSEWMVARLLDELRVLGTVDIREAFDEEGRLKPLKDIPDEVARAIAGVEVFEVYSSDKKELAGYTKRVKFYDKLRAIELLGKKLAMFVERHEHRHSLSLEKLVAGSQKEKVIDVTPEPDKRTRIIDGTGEKVEGTRINDQEL